MKKLIASILIFIMVTMPVMADDDLVRYFDSEIISTNYSYWGGLSLTYQGQSSFTQFGVNRAMSESLMEYRESKGDYMSYKSMNTVGNIGLWGGLFLTLFSPIYMATQVENSNAESNNQSYETSDGDYPSEDFGQFLVVYISGLIGMFIGAILLPLADSKILSSVNSFNRVKIGEY